MFDQLKSVVEGPPPRLDTTELSDECKEFVHLWLVRIICYMNTLCLKQLFIYQMCTIIQIIQVVINQ